MARPCFKLEKPHPMPLAGVDEAGCAPLAGPVVAAAVILDRQSFPRGIDDSKALPAKLREAICARLKRVAIVGVGIATVEEIDRLNIYWARMLAMARAVEALGVDPAMVLVDGNRCPKWTGPRSPSSPATPNAGRSLPLRSSPRSRATASCSNIRASIPAMAGNQ